MNIAHTRGITIYTAKLLRAHLLIIFLLLMGCHSSLEQDEGDDLFKMIQDDLVIITTNNDSLSLTNTAADTAYYLLFNPCALAMWALCSTPAECQALGTFIAPNATRQIAFSEASLWDKELPCVAVVYWFFGPPSTNYQREHETRVDIFLPENP